MTRLLTVCILLLSAASFVPADDTAAEMSVSLRRAFVRMEKDAALVVTIKNVSSSALENVFLDTLFSHGPQDTMSIASLPPGGRQQMTLPLPTHLKPSAYTCQLTLRIGDAVLSSQKIDYDIVGRRPPKMPVIMWNSYLPVNVDDVRLTGFTHSFLVMGDAAKLDCWVAKSSVDQADTDDRYRNNVWDLDRALKNDYGYIALVCPGAYLNNDPVGSDCMRVDAAGVPYENGINICPNFPDVQQFGFDLGYTISKTYARFPAFSGALVESEVRDHSRLCFHPHDVALLRGDTGMERVPVGINSSTSMALTEPARRGVVADQLPALDYLRWFWQKGDGWNPLASQTHDGLKACANEDVWTFTDPAVRTPSVSGSGGRVDVISQWTYSYPDPIKIGKATDELFAMAELSKNPRQKVMKMTQIIWYRSKTAPKRQEGTAANPLTPWEEAHADADFITIAPDHLREAFWCKIARPVQGIMYHDWYSLVECGAQNKTSYHCTNPESQKVLQELLHTVIKPLGPTLMLVPDRPGDVAFLQSFTSEMIDGVGEFGWGQGWSNDAYEILLYAALQPRIVYEETLLKNGLNPYKILVLINCPHLPQAIVGMAKAFQRRGGLIIGDENLCPALLPDILISSAARAGAPQSEKANLLAQAAQVCQELQQAYQRYVDTDNPEIIVRARQYKNTDYIFSVNDSRTFGDYVGGFGLVMEKGLSAAATLTVARPQGHVYDLVEHKKIDAASTDGLLSLACRYPPGGGKLYMITDTAIGPIEIKARDAVEPGDNFPVEIAVLDAQGNPLDAILPVRIDILMPDENLAEYSGFYAAVDGKIILNLDMALNDPLGCWTISAVELAGGLKTEKTFMLISPPSHAPSLSN